MIDRCEGCALLLPPSARFCPECGQRVAEGRRVATHPGHATVNFDGERRPVTAVFSDLVGSTQLSSTLDAEEYRDLIEAYQVRAVSIVRRFGGDVEGYSGDGILFRFGWPEAHDDDAAQALRASLEVASGVAAIESRHRLRVRIGVHSGTVVVGEMGGAERRATMLVGEVLNVSARLQSVAEPGTVVASQATIALVNEQFVVEDLGPQHLKGMDRTIHAYRVERPTRRRRPADPARRRTPLVGRSEELQVLANGWDRTRGGTGTAVLISGPPGVGKSRLVDELFAYASHRPRTWIASSCSPYTQMSVLWPVVQCLEQELRLDIGEEDHARLGRLRASLAAAGVDAPDAQGLVASLFGLPEGPLAPLGPERRLERTIEVLVTWLVALSSIHPTVLVVEDVHWCDPTTLDFLGRLLGSIGEAPMLVVITARPEFEVPWSESAVTRLGLRPLEDEDVRQLVRGLDEARPLPDPVVERIVGSAVGIPLYAEEVGRTLMRSGRLVVVGDRWELAAPLDDLEIPATLQGSLWARLDQLGPAKAIAQVASVIGRTFPVDLLTEVSGSEDQVVRQHLDRLVESELIEPQDQPDRVFGFRHVLVQEAAYASLLRSTRRTLHERTASALVSRRDSGATTAAEAIARHFEAAERPITAARYFQRAAQEATERSGHREAISFLQQAIALLDGPGEQGRHDELEVELQFALGSAILATRSYAHPEAQAAYSRARQLCERLGNDQRTGLTLAGLAIVYVNQGELKLCVELAQRTVEIGEAYGDDSLELLGLVHRSLARLYLGEVDKGLEDSRRARDLYVPRRHGKLARRFGTDMGVAALAFAGWEYLLLGYLDRGLASLEEAVELATTLGQPFNLVYALTFKSTGHWERGESALALADAGRARRMAEEQGFAFWARVSEVWEAGELLGRDGDRSQLDRILRAGAELAESGNRGGAWPSCSGWPRPPRRRGSTTPPWPSSTWR